MKALDSIQVQLQALTGMAEIKLEVPPDPQMGDFAFACFPLSKQYRKSPQEIAKDLSRRFPTNPLIQKVVAEGPYVNFFLNKAALASQLLPAIKKQGEKYGHSSITKEKVLIEFPSPNTNKPLHLGHLRNIFLGQALSSILSCSGARVIPVNLLNDRGAHICKSMLAYEKWGKGKKPDKKSDHFVGDFYVLYNQHASKDSELEKEVTQMLVLWEKGDKGVRALWKLLNAWAIKGFDQTFQRLGVRFEKTYKESEFYDKAKEVVFEGLRKGIFEKGEEGEIFVDLSPLPKKVLLRADGTSIYMTQDMYLAQEKARDFSPDRSIYIVGSEQNLHFQQLFKIFELMGFSWAKDCYHLSYGMVYLPEGKMKSREGTVVDADDLLDQMEILASTEIKKRYKDLPEKEIKKRSIMIGHGALRFYLLRVDPVRDMTYDPKESISFEGETGPYVQYTHARICSMLRKAKLASKVDYSLLSTKEEKHLLSLLSSYADTIADAAKQYRPSILARYLLDVTQSFNDYYAKHQVLCDDATLRNVRLAFVDSVRQVIANGLGLLHIEAPEEM